MKDNDFKERMWLKQLAVLKGQAFNIVEILKLTYAGPLELTRRENLLVIDDIMYMPNGKCDYDFMKSSLYESDILKVIESKVQIEIMEEVMVVTRREAKVRRLPKILHC